MALAAIDRYDAAPGYSPVERVQREREAAGPALAATTAVNTQSVFQALQTPDVEARRLNSLVASARAASVALVATPDETNATVAEQPGVAATGATATDPTDPSQQSGLVDRAQAERDAAIEAADEDAAAEEAAAEADAARAALQAPLDDFSTPSPRDVADAFAAVAATTPYDAAIDPAENDVRVDPASAISVREQNLADAAADEPPVSQFPTPDEYPGARLSRFA